MADTGIMATQMDVVRKAGNNISISTDDFTNQFIAEAEAEVNAATRYNWNANYSTLSTSVREILRQAVSNQAAIYLINYDLGNIGRTEAEDRVNILRDAFLRNIAILRDKKVQDFINGVTA